MQISNQIVENKIIEKMKNGKAHSDDKLPEDFFKVAVCT